MNTEMLLFRLHHAAFDRFMLGVRPSYVIHVRRDILKEVDGPMRRHGLQGLEGQRIVVPSRKVERGRVKSTAIRFSVTEGASGCSDCVWNPYE